MTSKTTVTFKIRSGDKIVCLVGKHRKLMRTSRTFLTIFHSNSYYENIMTFCSSLLSMFLEKKTTKTISTMKKSEKMLILCVNNFISNSN